MREQRGNDRRSEGGTQCDWIERHVGMIELEVLNELSICRGKGRS